LQQFTELLTRQTQDLSSYAVPPIWEPIFSVFLNQIEEAQLISADNVPTGALPALRDIVLVAMGTWPGFDRLHGKIESLLSTIQIPSFSNQAQVLAAPSLEGPRIPGVQGMITSDSNMFDSFPAPSSPELDGDAPVNQDMTDAPEAGLGALDTWNALQAGNVNDAGSSIPDFVTMDALRW
jgi:hypothetical protein